MTTFSFEFRSDIHSESEELINLYMYNYKSRIGFEPTLINGSRRELSTALPPSYRDGREGLIDTWKPIRLVRS